VKRFDADVRTIREAAKISQSQFAKLIGVNLRTLQNWEQQRTQPSGPASSLSDLAPFTGTRSVNGSLLIDALATDCLIKKHYVSKLHANRIKRHLHRVLFTPFFSFFILGVCRGQARQTPKALLKIVASNPKAIEALHG